MIHPLLEKLRNLSLKGMAVALEEQLGHPKTSELLFEERLGLLIDREHVQRENRRLTDRLRKAKLKQPACIEDIDYHSARELDKSVVSKLASSAWIRAHHNLLITGSTGTGKSYLACAFAHKACLEGYSARYLRVPRLFQELALSKADGRYPKLLAELAKVDLIILDDFGLATFTQEQRRDLLEILDDRHNIKSTLVTSQLPIDHWYEIIGDPTLADAILDRLIHSAYKLNLKGDSLRKKLFDDCILKKEEA
jgi:DNA replication protein DnaC